MVDRSINIFFNPITNKETAFAIVGYGFIMLVVCLYSKWHLEKYGV